MDGKTDPVAHNQTARSTHIALLCAFVLPLTLAILLLGVSPAGAALPIPTLAPPAGEELQPETEGDTEELAGEEDDAEEAAEDECETAEEEAAEGEITAAEAEAVCVEPEDGRGGRTADECPLRGARAHAVERHGGLRVTVGYTSSKATGATIEIRSGSARIASAHRRLGRSGVLRIVKRLGRRTFRRIAVRFRTPSCARFQTQPTWVR